MVNIEEIFGKTQQLGLNSESTYSPFDLWNFSVIGKGRYNKPKIINQEIFDAIKNRNFEAVSKNTNPIGLGLSQYQQNGVAQPEFDLIEMAAAYDAEPLVRRAIKRQVNLWFKEGFTLTGPKKRYVNYIKKRMREIAFVTGIPTQELVKQIVTYLLKYSNAFFIIVRNSGLSGGIKKPGQKAPIAGLFPVTPLSMFPIYKNGIITEWLRVVANGQRTLRVPASDVIHFTFDREDEALFGKPRLLGVIEDIAALRRMEENIELLVAKFLTPILHLKVGSDERPCTYYPDGSSELDVAKGIIQDMDQEGMLVTSERYNLNIHGAESATIDAGKYLQHFKSRLYSGLGVSALDVGEGDSANRSTADNISQNLKDMVIEDQQSFAAQFQIKVFSRLFSEFPGKLSVLNTFDQVNIKFFNVDMDTRIKFENHVINKFNNNLETMTESRDQLGKQPLSDEEMKDLRVNLIEIPLSLIISRDENSGLGKGESTGTGGGTSGKKKNPAANTTKTISQPENQHKKNLGPTKRKSSFEKQLIGKKFSMIIDSLVMCDSRDKAIQIVENSELDGIEKKYILSIVDKIFINKEKTDRRTDIIMELAQIAKFNS